MATKLKQLWWLMFIFAICNLLIAYFSYQGQGGSETGRVSLIPKKSVYQVGILQVGDLSEQDKMLDGTLAGLEAEGFKQGSHVKFDLVKVRDPKQLDQAAKDLVKSKKDLLITIGTDSTRAMARATRTIPVVGVGVMNFKRDEIYEDHENMTGIADIPAVLNQVKYASKCVPMERLGFLYNSSNEAAVVQLQLLRAVSEQKNLKLYEISFDPTKPSKPQIEKMIGHVDAVYIPEDRDVLAHFDEVVKILTAAKIPIIGEQAEMVKKGAFLSVSPDYYRMGFSGGQVAALLLRGKDLPSDIPIRKQSDPNLVLNMKQINALGINLPGDVWQRARKYFLYDGQPARA